MRNPAHDILFEPLQIGPKTVKNRFCQVAHCSNFGSDLPGANAYLRAMKAEGGWGLVNVEYCSISPEADDKPWTSARLWDDTDVANLGLAADKIHEHGALAGVPLTYGGPHSTGYETRVPARGASQMPSDINPIHSCYAMSKRDIRDLQQAYVNAAKRGRQAGFDLVTVSGGEAASVVQHFLMPFYNTRSDEYGGSFTNRARFWLETLEQVREAIGDDTAVAARFCVDTLDNSPMGTRVAEEGVAFIALADHLVDMWDLQVGAWMSDRFGVDPSPSRDSKENFQGAWVAQARPATTKPIVGVGRFTNPDTMVEVIRSGQLDMIGAARPTIADPFLPNKIDEGRLDDIRRCDGCNMCTARYNLSARLVCTQNATTGEEYRRGWHPERFPPVQRRDRSVLIVGAGPAGMECARVLAERGVERIEIVDAAGRVGGHMRWVTTLPGLAEWASTVDYRCKQLAKHDAITVTLNTWLTAEDVRARGADAVVIATGARWATNGINAFSRRPIPGADASLPNVLTPEQIVDEGKPVPEGRVVIFDTDGYYMGTALAELLAADGRDVTIVTPTEVFAPFTHNTGEIFGIKRRLRTAGVTIRTSTTVESFDGDVTVSLEGGDLETIGADALILVTQRESDDDLYRSLDDARATLEAVGIELLVRIGDCYVPRMLAESIYEGHRVAREFETEDPQHPLPYIREARVIGRGDDAYDAVIAAGGAWPVSSRRTLELVEIRS